MNERLLSKYDCSRMVIFPVLLSVVTGGAMAAEYTLSVQPALPPDQIQRNYQPLAAYLSKKTGHTISIKSYRNFLTYWIRMQKALDMDFIHS